MRHASRRNGRTALVAAALAASLALSGCSLLEKDDAPSGTPAPSPSASQVAEVYNSQFTRDGTFQSHIERSQLDFVYTLYPTKSTPRTNEWYPLGNKFFSFTFQAYDLKQGLRAPFATKRKVYLDTIEVTSTTMTVDGGKTQHPYTLDAVAKDVTFDPEPLATKYGMLITSPKGALELRNQRIKPTSLDTRGIELTFVATVWAETFAGSGKFYTMKIKQRVPIAIFESDEPTQVAKIPIDAN